MYVVVVVVVVVAATAAAVAAASSLVCAAAAVVLFAIIFIPVRVDIVASVVDVIVVSGVVVTFIHVIVDYVVCFV